MPSRCRQRKSRRACSGRMERPILKNVRPVAWEERARAWNNHSRPDAGCRLHPGRSGPAGPAGPADAGGRAGPGLCTQAGMRTDIQPRSEARPAPTRGRPVSGAPPATRRREARRWPGRRGRSSARRTGLAATRPRAGSTAADSFATSASGRACDCLARPATRPAPDGRLRRAGSLRATSFSSVCAGGGSLTSASGLATDASCMPRRWVSPCGWSGSTIRIGRRDSWAGVGRKARQDERGLSNKTHIYSLLFISQYFMILP